jgi:hypothetical protein
MLFISVIAISIIVFTSCTTTPVNYQLTTSCTPSNGGSVSPSGGLFKSGAEITLVATPATYFRFNGWAGDISGSTDRMTVKMNSNKNIVASFTKITYSLQVGVDNPSGGTIDPSGGNYDAGSQVKVTATPAKGYRFDHWGGSTTGSANQVSVLMDANKTVTAYFVKQYTLKVSSNPNDGGTINISNGVYDTGTQIKITGTQIFPYAFNNWSGTDTDAVNPTTVTIDSDKSIICNFVKLIPGDWNVESNFVYRGGTNTFSIELNQYAYVEGSISGYLTHVWIQDPTGATIKDLGSVSQTNFLITAQVPGRYSIILQNTDQMTLKYDYTIKYRIYRK